MDRKLTLSEMANHLGLSTKTFSKYVREYSIPHLRIGRSMRFDAKTVEAHLSARVTENIAKIKFSSVEKRSRLRKTNRFAQALGLDS